MENVDWCQVLCKYRREQKMQGNAMSGLGIISMVCFVHTFQKAPTTQPNAAELLGVSKMVEGHLYSGFS